MTRLAILDPSARADQPMRFDNATIVFNGEIYNFRELRADLRNLGWSFETTGDTEVLLKALLQWGERALERIRGMFAFLLWHHERHELWAARDAFGIKPLYWTPMDDGGAAFASEATALAELRGQRSSPLGVAEFLYFGSPYSVSAYDGVVELSPGELVKYRLDGTITVVPTAKVEAPEERLQDTLTSTVNRHLLSDRPVALFLSGGFDSALLASQVAHAEPPPTAITVDTGWNNDDVARAKLTARHYGIDHRIVSFSRGDISGHLRQYIESMDQPTIDGLNTLLVSDAANKAGFPVAISGLGGDEVLGGYGYYAKASRAFSVGHYYRKLPMRARMSLVEVVANRLHRLPSQLDSILNAETTVALYHAWRNVFTREETWRLTGVEVEPVRMCFDGLDTDLASELKVLDFGLYLRSTLLRDSDVFSMACGVEIRVPLLDEVFVSQAKRVPGGATKAGLSRSIGDSYLESLANLNKLTFRMPWDKWIGELVPWEEVIHEGAPWKGLVDPAEARSLSIGSGSAGGDRILALTILALWLERVGKPRRIEPRPV